MSPNPILREIKAEKKEVQTLLKTTQRDKHKLIALALLEGSSMCEVMRRLIDREYHNRREFIEMRFANESDPLEKHFGKR